MQLFAHWIRLWRGCAGAIMVLGLCLSFANVRAAQGVGGEDEPLFWGSVPHAQCHAGSISTSEDAEFTCVEVDDEDEKCEITLLTITRLVGPPVGRTCGGGLRHDHIVRSSIVPGTGLPRAPPAALV